jgi:hypothetical protein
MVAAQPPEDEDPKAAGVRYASPLFIPSEIRMARMAPPPILSENMWDLYRPQQLGSEMTLMADGSSTMTPKTPVGDPSKLKSFGHERLGVLLWTK